MKFTRLLAQIRNCLRIHLRKYLRFHVITGMIEFAKEPLICR